MPSSVPTASQRPAGMRRSTRRLGDAAHPPRASSAGWSGRPTCRVASAPAAHPRASASSRSRPSASATASAPLNASPAPVVSTTLDCERRCFSTGWSRRCSSAPSAPRVTITASTPAPGGHPTLRPMTSSSCWFGVSTVTSASNSSGSCCAGAGLSTNGQPRSFASQRPREHGLERDLEAREHDRIVDDRSHRGRLGAELGVGARRDDDGVLMVAVDDDGRDPGRAPHPCHQTDIHVAGLEVVHGAVAEVVGADPGHEHGVGSESGRSRDLVGALAAWQHLKPTAADGLTGSGDALDIGEDEVHVDGADDDDRGWHADHCGARPSRRPSGGRTPGGSSSP